MVTDELGTANLLSQLGIPLMLRHLLHGALMAFTWSAIRQVASLEP